MWSLLALCSTVPRITTVTATSNSYNSIQLTVTLLYTGGRTVTEFLIRYRMVNTPGWKSLPVTTNYTNISTPWSYSFTDLQYDQHGYEVEVTATNSIGDSNTVTSSPTKLSTGTHTVQTSHSHNVGVCSTTRES